MAELWKWRIRNAPFASNENVAQLSHETSTVNNKDLYYIYLLTFGLKLGGIRLECYYALEWREVWCT